MSKSQQHEDWDDCPQGELSQLVGRLNASQQQDRRKQLYSSAAACVLLVACGIFVASSFLNSANPKYGGITCSECKVNFAAFHDFKTKEADLDTSIEKSMTAHLEQCKLCRNFFEQTYPGVLTTAQDTHFSLPLFAVASSSSSLY